MTSWLVTLSRRSLRVLSARPDVEMITVGDATLRDATLSSVATPAGTRYGAPSAVSSHATPAILRRQ